MNPRLLTFCTVLQVVILCAVGGTSGLGLSAILVVIFALFAFTRERWDAHLDMILVMAGLGGLGMMAAMLMGPACHTQWWLHYAAMSGGMLVLSLPLCWRYARCMLEARRNGSGGVALTIDIVGMQAGMALAHLPSSVMTYSPWLQHALMLMGMLLGMMVGMTARRAINSPMAFQLYRRQTRPLGTWWRSASSPTGLRRP